MSIEENAKQAVRGAVQGVIQKIVELAPDSWLPGGKPDPLIWRKGVIGAPVSRIDGPLKVQGNATFAAEFPLDDMVYAALVFSTIAKGRIATLDTTEAEAAPGVILVMTHRNAPRMQPMPLFDGTSKGAGFDNLPIMQDDQVYWNGQPVALVLAETQEQADHARSLIRATYEIEPATTGFAQAKANGTVAGQYMGPLHLEIGDAEAALAAAAVSVDVTYRTPYQNHNAIELHAATVAWNGDELMVHDTTQAVTHTAWSLAQIFGIDEKQVHVTSPYVGGGFGGKGLWQHQPLGAAAAKLAKRPVRITLSREGVYRVVGGRPFTEQRVAIGANSDGRFETIIHTGTAVSNRHNNVSEPFTHPTLSLYAASNFKLDLQLAFVDMVPNTAMRAPGTAVGNFTLECAVDELAVALAMDPIELRIRNEPDKNPTDGKPFSSRHIVEAWRAGAERFGWEKRNPIPGTVREGEWLVGIGCATANYPYFRMPGGAARITLTKDGHAKVEVAAHEMGMGTATVQTQVIAERLGLAPDRVSFGYGDSTLPGIVIAVGSQQTVSIGAAVVAAQHALVTELLKLIDNDSPLAGLKADEIGCLDGGLAKLDEPERHESYASILARAGRDEVTAEASAPPPFEMMHWSMHSFGGMFCEVRVNAITGETRVSRFLASMDCGRILNAKTAASQFRGGIIMGLGLALMEETQFDERNGRIVNPSLAEYHVPVQMDVPEIDVIWTDIPDPHAPMGAHGIGEIGITGTGAAVANAIFNATGKRIRDLPLTLDKLM
jgi:xanthine dehydrogenase YagR molybdenum-binding subunit